MGMRFHTTTTFKVEYGSTIHKELTDDIIDIFRNNGWVSEDECEAEMDFQTLSGLIEETPDGDLKNALQLIYDESDKENDFARISLF